MLSFLFSTDWITTLETYVCYCWDLVTVTLWTSLLGQAEKHCSTLVLYCDLHFCMICMMCLMCCVLSELILISCL